MNTSSDSLCTTHPPQSALEGLCIHEAFARQASLTPDSIALTFGEQGVCYADLENRANRLANYLCRRGAGPEVRIALYLDRSVDMVVAILAVLKAGAAYVPIDLAYPADRIGFMLEDSTPAILITHSGLASKLPKFGGELLILDSAHARISSEPVSAPRPAVTRQNACYVIYTSGSTGRPKGVVVTQHNVLRLFSSTEPWYRFSAADVWPLFHSYSFDMSVWELWGSLLYGGRLVIVPFITTRSPDEFYNLLAREQVTFLNQTPSAFRQLIWAAAKAEKPLKLSLRFVTLGGEALELQTLKPWFKIYGDQQPTVVNKYGITETTVHTTYRPIRQKDLEDNLGSVIGIPIPDLTVHLLDSQLRPVVKGPGEICVGGEGVARGYLNRPQLTSERFVPDPFSTKPGATLYRSGDLAQINSRGEMEYLGRMDQQVKIRGFRIELGEIESTLNRHPAVRESVVLALPTDGSNETRLAAYYVPVKARPVISALREHLQRTLPDYMVPAHFVPLETFPLTNNGKIDRRALPLPESSRPELAQDFVAPVTDTERTLVTVWRQVLGIEEIGIHDNFFELGGDSIRSIAVISKAQEHGLHISLEQIFQTPTVAGLARCSTAGRQDREFRPSTSFSLISKADRALLPEDVEDAYPVARLQLGMFFRNDLNPTSAIYHDIFSYRVETRFQEDCLRKALQQFTDRHPIMRTSFHLAGYSEPLQTVHRKASPELTAEDIRDKPSAEQQVYLAEWVEAEKRRPFDRSRAPLARWHVLQLSENIFQLIFSFHHCCLDGWSLAAAVTEILTDYHTLVAGGGAAGLTRPALTYRDFIDLERQSISSAACRDFWSTKLRDAPLHGLPRWPAQTRTGGQEQVRGPELVVDPAVFDGLKRLAKTCGVSLKTVLFAAHTRVMSAVYGQNDLTTGLLCNGRPEERDGERLIGLFLNTVPVRVHLKGGTWQDLVRQTFEAEREMMPYRRFPLAEIQKLLGGNPVFESAFDFVHFHVYKHLNSCPGLTLSEGHYFEANDLPSFTTFMLDITSTVLQMHIDYDPNLLCREQVEQMSHHYIATLRAMAANPDGRYESFSPLSAMERDRILVQFNQSKADYPRNQCLHQLISSRAAETPDAVAVVAGTESLTYAELDKASDAVAKELSDLKIGADMPVAVYMERSPRMVVALLGILKAGGAYVPLDPAFPAERLAFMLKDCRATVTVTQDNFREQLPGDTKVLCIDSHRPLRADSTPPNPVLPDNLAYIIYTSGSTGIPKGVQITHRSVVNLLLSAARTTGAGSRDRLLAVTTLSFDIAGLEIFMPLLLGGSVVIANRETASDAKDLAELIDASGATIMQATPATWRMLIESGWDGSPGLKAFCGGEALSQKLAEQLLTRTSELWNFYGPTETTIWSTASRILPGETVAIGKPLANTEIFILDTFMSPVPVCAVGELYIAGDGLARGYWQRPELTSERFVKNPFSTDPASRLYKTGDLAKFLPDGRIECLGRIDHQVKIRGFRIELGEVEHALRQHPAVLNAVVRAKKDNFGENRLIAYLTHTSNPGTAELRAFLQARIPAYMVPSQFVLLKDFPLTPNGKIDLNKLPDPEAALASRSYTAPRDLHEEKLAGIWRQALGVSQIGVEDNFFELGCDSLSATRAFARINRDFGSEIHLRDIFENPTIAGLVQVVRDREGRIPFDLPITPRRQRHVSSQQM